MIKVRLTGGLGNQLFQYAAGLSLADQHKVPIQLDLSTLPLDGRQFRLDQFQIEAKILDPAPVEEPSKSMAERVSRALRRRVGLLEERIEQSKPWYAQKLVVQPQFHFSPDFFKAGADADLQGYWQSPKYFQPVEPLVRTHFRFVNPIYETNPSLADRLLAPNSLGLHVRRGDYVSNPIFAAKYRLMDANYYAKAIEEIRARTEIQKIFVFSDDLPWCRENLSSLGDVEMLDGGSDMGDFQYLSLCHHHVISNSTFAWWAAWLAGRPGQIVAGPKEWFFNDNDLGDLCPPDWVLI